MNKYLVFGFLGALGCLLGCVLGEGLLALNRSNKAQAGQAPSLVAPEPPPLAAAEVQAPLAPALAGAAQLKSPPAPPAEVKERVLARGGNFTGDIVMSLTWDNRNDLDLHCIDPAGEHIYFKHRE